MVRPVRSRLFSSVVLAAVFLLPASSIATAEAFTSTFNSATSTQPISARRLGSSLARSTMDFLRSDWTLG